jgi:hypothetical protein
MSSINLNNKGLTSLVGMVPEGVEFVYCNHNYLTSLEGLPEGVKEVYCSYNNLTSLEGLPEGVEHVSCYKNPYLTSPTGLPDSVLYVDCDRYTPLWMHCVFSGKISYEEEPQGIQKIINYI